MKLRVGEGVGAPAEEQCGGRGQVDLSPRVENRKVFIFPESPGMRCTSGNAICRSSCGLQTPAVSLPSSSHVLEVGAQEQEVLGETRQDSMAKASPTPKRCISHIKERPTSGEARTRPETRSAHKSPTCLHPQGLRKSWLFPDTFSKVAIYLSFPELLLPGRPHKCPLCHLNFLSFTNNTKLGATEVYSPTSLSVSIPQRGGNSEREAKSNSLPQ